MTHEEVAIAPSFPLFDRCVVREPDLEALSVFGNGDILRVGLAGFVEFNHTAGVHTDLTELDPLGFRKTLGTLLSVLEELDRDSPVGGFSIVAIFHGGFESGAPIRQSENI